MTVHLLKEETGSTQRTRLADAVLQITYLNSVVMPDEESSSSEDSEDSENDEGSEQDGSTGDTEEDSDA